MWCVAPSFIDKVSKRSILHEQCKGEKMSKALSIEVAEPNFNPSERFSDPRLEKWNVNFLFKYVLPS